MEKAQRKILWGGSRLVLRPGLLFVSVLSLFLAVFRPGLTVTVGEQKLPGVYSPTAVWSCLRAAEAAAWEITGDTLDLSGAVSVTPGLGVGGLSRDTRTLERLLLESAPGVKKLWAVRLDGEFLGWAADPSVLGELTEAFLAENSGPDTASAGFGQKLTAKTSYVRAETAADRMALSGRLREAVRVETESLGR